MYKIIVGVSAVILFILSTYVTLPVVAQLALGFSIGASAGASILSGYLELKDERA